VILQLIVGYSTQHRIYKQSFASTQHRIYKQSFADSQKPYIAFQAALYTLGCIRNPQHFSYKFYLVLKCCIYVRNMTSKFFCNRLMFRSALRPPMFDQGFKTCKYIMKISYNLVTTSSMIMILMSNPTKI